MVLPDFRSRFIEGSDNIAVIAAGLPNITGEFGANEGYGDYASGAFYVSSPNNRMGTGDSDNDNATIYFDASRCSSIYGASTTVQPPTIALIPQIKY